MATSRVHPQPHLPRSRPAGRLTSPQGQPGPATEEAVFTVDWQVRPGSPEADTADAVAPQVQLAPRRDGLSFDIARALGTVVVSLAGTLEVTGTRVLRDVLADLIENQGNMAVVVDLDGVSEVDPACLDIFVTAHGWAVMRGGQLSLTGVRHRVAAALESSGVGRLVKVTSDRILAFPGPAASPDRELGGAHADGSRRPDADHLPGPQRSRSVSHRMTTGGTPPNAPPGPQRHR